MLLRGDFIRQLPLALILLGSPGCSYIFTKGPQPELNPRPECTTSVAAPVVDTVFGVLGVGLLGLAVAEEATSCTGDYCGIGKSTAGVAAVVGGAMGALFISSAVVGYERTSSCRASLEPGFVPTSALPSSHPDEPPVEGCAPLGDAPRLCARPVPWPGGG